MTSQSAQKAAVVLVRTVDLGSNWFARVWSDGSLTLLDGEMSQRIDVPKASVDTLRAIIASVN